MKANRVEFTGPELKWFLFSKKECPRCGGQLTKKKHYEIHDGKEFARRMNLIHSPHQKNNVNLYKYTFVCDDCCAEFPLEELAAKK